MSMHLTAKPGEIANRILLPGDPLRAKWIAENFLTDIHCYNEVRGMYGFNGTYKGERIAVQGTGMGAPSISLYAHELFTEYEVERAIRVGTCGAISPNIKLGDLIIAMTASTDSGINRRRTNGLDFAPCADYSMLRAAADACKTPVHIGGVASMDLFYDDSDAMDRLKEHGVLAVEMETSALYSLAARHGRQALSILTVSDQILTHEVMSTAQREQTLNSMVEVALTSLLS
jgi:purine-nucleoside phosphorylase